ncbi:MAG: glycosyl transferase family 1 [endosymbiont of Galathealinum brachiosum]|uniref:Glycosyl transferase family 1 n=1 Tax=endosymbiont of Galathealinum brachiosum TaxID=2200906 RepID=A0A370DA20_9GAMM|nr:MAG: glycosyl transferase family 1 [endosymbiont of Galathealinum brachiosum]
MKVLLAHCYYRSSAPSGEDSVFRSEKELLEINKVEVIPYEKYNDDVKISTIFDSVNTAINTIWSSSSYSELVGLIKKHSPDVVHFHNTFPQLSPSVYKACYDNNVAVVQTLHNYRLVCPGGMLLRNANSCELCLDGSKFPTPSIKHKCYRNSITATLPLALMIARNRFNGAYNKYVNRYIALTQFAKDRFIRGALLESKLTIKPNFLGVNTELCVEKENYVVFVGRLSEEKGIKTLIHAWSEINNVKLKVLGDGHLRESLEEEVRAKKSNVEFLGFCSQQELLEVIKRASLQIIPSECYEGFPVSVLEAFSCGTPVIASCLGSLQEIIDDEETGVLFEPKNEKDLVEKIKGLLADTAKRTRLALNARSVFDKKYSQDINFKILMDIYNDAISDMKNSKH